MSTNNLFVDNERTTVRVIAHAVRTVSLGMVALLGAGTLTAVAAPPVPPPVAKGNNWGVDAGAVRGTVQRRLVR